MTMADSLDLLNSIRDRVGPDSARTSGLSNEIVARFCLSDDKLIQAINEAVVAFDTMVEEFGIELLQMEETKLISLIQNIFSRSIQFRESCICPSQICYAP